MCSTLKNKKRHHQNKNKPNFKKIKGKKDTRHITLFGPIFITASFHCLHLSPCCSSSLHPLSSSCGGVLFGVGGVICCGVYRT